MITRGRPLVMLSKDSIMFNHPAIRVVASIALVYAI
jgi:hypothetical protein